MLTKTFSVETSNVHFNLFPLLRQQLPSPTYPVAMSLYQILELCDGIEALSRHIAGIY